MSQLRGARPPAAVGGPGGGRAKSRGRRPGASPAGDCQAVQNKSKKNKLPKNVRYDLENALLGLCDVWFEEIKPYLVRNNIKLHTEPRPPAPADHNGPPTPANHNSPTSPSCPTGTGGPTRECQHRDPASSSGACQLCRLLLNAANSIHCAVTQAACAGAAPAAAPTAPAAPACRPRPDQPGPR